MKILSIYLDGNHIEYHNSLFGLETILCNGEVVSKKYSLMGANHRFEAGSHTYRLQLTSSLAGSYIDLYRDDLAIIESNKNGCLVILLVTVFILFLLDYLYGLTHS